jgi:hypothetical protein
VVVAVGSKAVRLVVVVVDLKIGVVLDWKRWWWCYEVGGENIIQKRYKKKNIPEAHTTCLNTSFGLFFCLFLASLG